MFIDGKCYGCCKKVPILFIVQGKEHEPRWNFCSTKCIRNVMTITKASAWAKLTNKREDIHSNENTEKLSKKKKK